MPFTPLHMGPGLVVKACLQGAFSLTVFGWSQILIDLQPLYVLLTGNGDLHGLSHTYIGATGIALVAALTGKRLSEIGLRFIAMQAYNPISWPVAFASAFIGTYSHVLIDGIMHADMAPFAPLSEARFLFGVIGLEILHILCIASAVVGSITYFIVDRLRRKAR